MPTHNSFVCSAAVACLLVLAGCALATGPGDGGDALALPGDADVRTTAGFCAALGYYPVRSNCDYFRRCCSAAEQPIANSASIDQFQFACASTPDVSGCVASLDRGIADGRVVFQVDAIADCVLAVAAEVGPPSQCGHLGAVERLRLAATLTSAACQRAVHGTQALGMPCNSGFECGPGAMCIRLGGDAGAGGVCTAMAATGASCARTTDCAPPNWCLDGACQPSSGEGGPCTDSPMCQAGLYCDVPSAGARGVCRTRLADGAACTRSMQCESGYCVTGLCTPLCVGR